ncbi:bifunctional proline dehydrogenase/L-glutamate gamma-semialdehyde dehydrogenase PutA [Roseomonas haemaphysalidis]|uniref:Bifunctional protein PutA n=1 Tax=Roseomonas haemaphysalidis TaxID=2768162 RepID=A0ABS3KX91_9PROT|nr:bifunctional proline dehydrogenase/L-glutamate gamma-semialdehyde dehydrogenase PutA [Roseomonas haemaphysalidis]MBO1080961.1 bifunctional proline dehydrogenase/L-glutamate gamma-semialdehyde dehydrogenase PutA [Roseomonas haemaphysalidis]
MPDDLHAVPPAPFAGFGPVAQSALRDAITAQTRAPEGDCVARLLGAAALTPAQAARAEAAARGLVLALRARGDSSPVEGLVREYSLSSQEGVALMCLAEALLRIPDAATRDALIRDKIAPGDWRAHLGQSRSLFVNAATWGLVVTGKLVSAGGEQGLSRALTRLLARGGEPVIRRGVDLAMRMMGEQFVTGETIAKALRHARALEAKGFRYSYDMLGEAAMTAADATRYDAEYQRAIQAIGTAAGGKGIYEGPGISIKLSALHPRYSRAQRDRVMAELYPRLLNLALLARAHDIGLNIDAEETDRLELSLDLLERLCFEPALAGWHGVGFVVQAYQKRAPFVLDWIIDLARRSGHRIMLRLVKGAYWDSEIKRAQQDGQPDFPVFTRKAHTDVSYLACAAKLLAAPDAVFPQFATHNAQTVGAIHAMAGEDFSNTRFEFQCLHGMGEPLYEAVRAQLNRPARIYAPVGTHETLLAYLVRRLLENGANASFVNRIQDPAVPVDALVADPVAAVAATAPATPHPAIALPPALLGDARRNSAGLDLADEHVLAALAPALRAGGAWQAAPATGGGRPQPVRNPADRRDVVGQVRDAGPADIEAALAAAASCRWADTPAAGRAALLTRAAALLEARRPELLGLIVREAGKTLPNAVAEIREAVDFLRFYATLARDEGRPLGPVACISPWNFPLAIFTGQVAAALAAGNPVLAKPAEETPLVAARAVAILHEAGIPADALHLLPGEGPVGAALVADPRVQGVMFTGSTEVARKIQQQLARRLSAQGTPVPLVAETGGQNALVADSSALAEQVVADVLLSAFDSAGQRCSALRVLCLQEEAADRTLTMLRGALAELSVGNPDRLSTDIGPVITDEARDGIEAHIARMRAAGNPVHQAPLPAGCARGSFVAPTIIEIGSIAELTGEVFGPVLHVLRFRRDGLPALLDAINATGFGLTFGVHSRIEDTIAQATAASGAGNLYVNRNMVGAVVGVQPFGGHGLSGTGPKAGGPMALARLRPAAAALPPGSLPPGVAAWLEARGEAAPATPLGVSLDLPGPVGERNRYETVPRGDVLCVAATPAALLRQVAAALVTGNRALVPPGAALPPLPGRIAEAGAALPPCDAVLFDGAPEALLALGQELAQRPGPLVPLLVAAPGGRYPLEMLVLERSISTNLAAAGGNAALMAIG